MTWELVAVKASVHGCDDTSPAEVARAAEQLSGALRAAAGAVQAANPGVVVDLAGAVRTEADVRAALGLPPARTFEDRYREEKAARIAVQEEVREMLVGLNERLTAHEMQFGHMQAAALTHQNEAAQARAELADMRAERDAAVSARDTARAAGERYITRIRELARDVRVLRGTKDVLTEQRDYFRGRDRDARAELEDAKNAVRLARGAMASGPPNLCGGPYRHLVRRIVVVDTGDNAFVGFLAATDPTGVWIGDEDGDFIPARNIRDVALHDHELEPTD